MKKELHIVWKKIHIVGEKELANKKYILFEKELFTICKNTHEKK